MSVEYGLFQVGESGEWRVIAEIPGKDPMIAIFSGPGAKERANAYALWMNGRYPTAKRNALDIVDVNGRKFTLVLDGIEWSSDLKRGTVTARQKSSIIQKEKPIQNVAIGEPSDTPQL